MKNNCDVNSMDILALAHMGDCVYELMTRTYFCNLGLLSLHEIHNKTVSKVNAAAQALAFSAISDKLFDDELAVFKRGRNAKVNSIPKKASTSDYHYATGIEALFGYLYLNNRTDRIEELYNIISQQY